MRKTIVLKKKIIRSLDPNIGKEFMEKSQPLLKNSTSTSVSLKDAAASNSLPCLSKFFFWTRFHRKKKKSQQFVPVGPSHTLINLINWQLSWQSYKIIPVHPMALDYTIPPLVGILYLGERWTTLHLIPENILTLVENEGAPTHTRKLDSIFQKHKRQMFLLREIRAWHRLLENKTKKKKQNVFHSTSQMLIWKT